VKVKLDKQQEFVVGGYRPGNHGVDALLVALSRRPDAEVRGERARGITP
jgi:hypothetical protein